ncbi:MAG: aquaporin family protein [Bacteroidales bacterium]|nr:aquaporin family protein [Bacteroidales bacterium]
MTLLTKCIFEFLGTLVLILLGDGVCCATSLNKSKAQGAGWAVITLGWGLAVMCGVFIAGPYSGAHLNPAVTLGFAIAGQFDWCAVLPYIAAQMLGGFAGAVLVYIFYKDHFDATDDQATKLGVFCTAPAIMNKGRNFFCEALASWLLVFVILALGTKENLPEVGMGELGAFPVTMLIVAIGMSLGATTGYAINPARDLAPRIAHAVLPIKNKGGNGWDYSWVPVAGPILGGLLAAFTYMLIY